MKTKNVLVTLFTILSTTAFAIGLPSAKDLPAYRYYQTFDTSIVHYMHGVNIGFRDTITLRLTHNECDYRLPLDKNIRVTSVFGKRWRRMHQGFDLDLESGDNVNTVFEGMVRYAKYNKSYGNLVIVRHPNGLETYYAHLSAINVQAGQYVQAGDLVGLGGNTGRSFGSHLHFEIRFQGAAINPSEIIDFSTGRLRFSSMKVYLENGHIKVSDSAKFHKVGPGDTIYSIARKYNLPISEILQLNNLREEDHLLIDQLVKYEM